MENIFYGRIEALRALMRENNWDIVILTGSDPHSSEYPAPRWKQVEWLSGFTGEAGDIVVTLDHAGLWTDTRYFIQAVQQLEGSGIVLHKTRIPEQVLIPEWLSSVAFCGRNYVNIAVDGLCQNVSFIQEIKDAFDEDTEVRIVSVPDLLECLWTDRPPVPATPIIKLSDAQVGESSEDKIEWLRAFLRSKGCDNMLLTALDGLLKPEQEAFHCQSVIEVRQAHPLNLGCVLHGLAERHGRRAAYAALRIHHIVDVIVQGGRVHVSQSLKVPN